MSDDKYLRKINDLEKVASKWWPKEVRKEAMKVSILHYLLDTQEKFISLLTLADRTKPEKLFDLIEASSLDYHVFLKHLILLTDVGSEPIQRFNSSFNEIFPKGKLDYVISNQDYSYQFFVLPIKSVPNNKRMQIDTIENLKSPCRNVNLCKDLIMFLIYGAASNTPSTAAVLYKCNAYEYLGQEDLIKKYVRQNYIRVSRIVSGKEASDLGNVAQSYAVHYLAEHLGDDYNVVSTGTIPNVKMDDNKDVTFDIVVDRKSYVGDHKGYVGIEVSFQETSNSVIERKAREARARFQNTNNKRCYVAYIIDGVGNFSRTSAVKDLCDNSHCNVAYTPSEFDLLIEFIKEKIG